MGGEIGMLRWVGIAVVGCMMGWVIGDVNR